LKVDAASVADELGSAVLTLSVNDKDLKQKLQDSKTLLNELGKDAATLGTSLGKAFSKEYRLRLNDSQLVAAALRVDTLQRKLQEIAADPINIRLNLIQSGLGAGGAQISAELIARQAKEALSGGLSGQLTDILSGGVSAARTSELRSTLLSRLERGSLSSGGFNVAGLKEVITQLGGTPTGNRTELLKQARTAIKTANEAVIVRVGKDLLDLQMMFSGGFPPSGGGGGDRLRRILRSIQDFITGDDLLRDLEPFRAGPRGGRPPRPPRPPEPPQPPAPPPPPPPQPPQRQLGPRPLQLDRQGLASVLSNALIGGAFPALFGQGLGASLGGAAGGAAGGALGGQFGFGLSLIGTALGAQFDLAGQKSKTLAEALNDPIGKFAELVEAGLLSSKALERNAKALIESGRAAEAAALIQLDLNKTFAGTATGNELTSVTDELGRAFTRLSVSMTQFSSGPLTGLLKLLGARFENDFQRNRSIQIESELRQAGLGSQADELRRQQFVPILKSDTAEISRINDEFVNKIPRVQKANAQANADIAASQRSIEASQRLGFKITQASTQGYKIQTLELQKQEVLNARNRKLLELKPQERTGIQAQDIQADAAQKLFDLDTQINELRQERVALATEEAAKYQLAGEKLQQELKAVQALAALSQNAQRTAQFAVQQSTLSTIQGIEASVADAQRREREIGAQIDAARIRGGDAGEQEATRLVQEQVLAANQTRFELETGARALTEAGIKLREDVQTAFLNLQKLRTGNQGLNEFLNPQDRARREEQTFQALLPSLRTSQRTFERLTGARAPEFSGPTASVNESIIKFIEAVNAEQRALDTANDTQAALNDNTAALAGINAELRTTIAELNAKNWAVNVNVAADGSSQVTGDVQNSFLSVPS
jgi:hypothetical protein